MSSVFWVITRREVGLHIGAISKAKLLGQLDP